MYPLIPSAIPVIIIDKMVRFMNTISEKYSNAFPCWVFIEFFMELLSGLIFPFRFDQFRKVFYLVQVYLCHIINKMHHCRLKRKFGDSLHNLLWYKSMKCLRRKKSPQGFLIPDAEFRR